MSSESANIQKVKRKSTKADVFTKLCHLLDKLFPDQDSYPKFGDGFTKKHGNSSLLWFPWGTGADSTGKYWRSGAAYDNKVVRYTGMDKQHKVQVINMLKDKNSLGSPRLYVNDLFYMRIDSL